MLTSAYTKTWTPHVSQRLLLRAAHILFTFQLFPCGLFYWNLHERAIKFLLFYCRYSLDWLYHVVFMFCSFCANNINLFPDVLSCLFAYSRYFVYSCSCYRTHNRWNVGKCLNSYRRRIWRGFPLLPFHVWWNISTHITSFVIRNSSFTYLQIYVQMYT